jgi:ABC-2 type transport system ATP-binding protein
MASIRASKRTAVLGTIGFVPQLPPPLKMPVGATDRFFGLIVRHRSGNDIHATCKAPRPRPRWHSVAASSSSLSGGMKQKLLIAIALGRDAKVLVMDEPAANLDPEARKIFFDLLAERLEDVDDDHLQPPPR